MKMLSAAIFSFVVLRFVEAINFTTTITRRRIHCLTTNNLRQKYAISKMDNSHHYRGLYCSLFQPILNVELNLLEIGVGCGHLIDGQSPILWGNYFKNGHYTAIDYLPQNQHEKEKCFSNLKNAYPLADVEKSKTVFLQEVIKDYKSHSHTFDVIIDDNGHNFQQIQTSMIELWPYLSKGGIYIIEDLNMDSAFSKRMGDWMTLISSSNKESGTNRKSATFSKRMADWMALVSSSEREKETVKKLSTFNVEEMGCSYQICYFKKSLEISNINHDIISLKNYRKDLVYICLFGDVKYAILANLMFESILLNCENDLSFDIIIYTSTEIRKKIMESSLISKLRINRRLIFNINDNIRTKAEACSSRLDLFNFPQIKNYKRILYLDSDVIVIQNLAPLFNLIKEDKFYVLKETEDMTKSDNYYGRDLFGKEIFKYQDKSGFNSGLLLFNNCEIIKILFLVIRMDMKRREKQNPFYDQPFFNYNAKKLNVSESNVLISYVLPSLKFLSLYRNPSVYPLNGTAFGRNRNSAEQNITLIHFLGGVEAHTNKILEMKRFLSELKRSSGRFTLMTN